MRDSLAGSEFREIGIGWSATTGVWVIMLGSAVEVVTGFMISPAAPHVRLCTTGLRGAGSAGDVAAAALRGAGSAGDVAAAALKGAGSAGDVAAAALRGAGSAGDVAGAALRGAGSTGDEGCFLWCSLSFSIPSKKKTAEKENENESENEHDGPRPF
jgi:hypothetical protein